MHRQARFAAWSALALILVLALAACGGDDPEPTSEPDAATAAPTQTPAATEAAMPEADAADAEATTEAAPDQTATADAEAADAAAEDSESDDAALDFTVYTPGLHARSGLTVVRSTEHAAGDTGAYFAEVRNDTGQLLRIVEGSLDLLDAEYYRLGTVPLSVLLNDIAPGRSFYLGETFTLPEGYADAAIWLDYTLAEEPSLDAFDDLPVTIEAQGPGDSAPYVVSGTIENTSGRDLHFWAVTLVALDAGDQIIGLAHAVVTPGTTNRVWPTGAAAAFNAPFSALAGDASAVASVVPSVTGYALLD